MNSKEAIEAIKSNYPSKGTYTILAEALDMAIEALEKQIPTDTRETIVYKLSGYDVEAALEEMRIDYTEEQLHDIIDYIDERSLDIPWTVYMIPTIEMAIEDGVMGSVPYNPEEGDMYYYPSFDICTMWLNGIWDDTKRDENTKKAVGVYRTKEEAIAKAKELWGLEEELK